MKALTSAGRTDEARDEALLDKVFVSAHGGTPIRPAAEYHAIMREVAEEYGAELVDAGAILAQTPSHYYDWCHLDTTGHRRVADLLRSRIEPLLPEAATQ